MAGVGRTAPSVTGPAHPGTLLSALLAWLDARSRGDHFIVRLEDTDHTRVRPGLADSLRRDLEWFGLDWDRLDIQTDRRAAHEAALDRLAAAGHLYPCSCSRRRRLQSGRPSPDGGVAYDNTCRSRPLPGGSWRRSEQAIRLRLPDEPIQLEDEAGLDLSQEPARDLGDPVVVRRDGALAYHLVVVLDDADSGVSRVIRGRDIAPLTATQVLIHRLLDRPVPSYRHHFLLLEPRGHKLAKLHGSVSVDELRSVYDPAALCGLLAHAAGLRPDPAPASPSELLASFDWAQVRREDLVAEWTGGTLELGS